MNTHTQIIKAVTCMCGWGRGITFHRLFCVLTFLEKKLKFKKTDKTIVTPQISEFLNEHYYTLTALAILYVEKFFNRNMDQNNLSKNEHNRAVKDVGEVVKVVKFQPFIKNYSISNVYLS